MYVELIHFQRGVFLRKETPFFTKEGYKVYDKAVAKHSEMPGEYMICLRHDNHLLVKSWTNVKPTLSLKERVTEAKGKKKKS